MAAAWRSIRISIMSIGICDNSRAFAIVISKNKNHLNKDGFFQRLFAPKI